LDSTLVFRHRQFTQDKAKDTVAITIVRLGSPRGKDEGLRIGTVRRPPRGVRKEDYASKNFYDVWFPNLSPSEALLKKGHGAVDAKSWRAFRRQFLAELKAPDANRALDLLAALSHHVNMAIGCYCRHENLCHRSILREVLVQKGADVRNARQEDEAWREEPT
jgi:uncharacterized protein YeaO (DUF488 family)